MKGIVQDTKKTNLALIEEACEISLSKAGQTIVGNIAFDPHVVLVNTIVFLCNRLGI